MKFKNLIPFLFSIAISSTALCQNDKDLTSVERPIDANVVVNANKNLEKLLAVKYKENYSDNYKIQLYYGNLNGAHGILSKFNEKFSEWPGKIEYETPNYKVWVGNYSTRLEADRAILKISKEFPNAFIFKPEK